MKQTIASIALLLLCASSAYARNDTVEYDIAAALVAEHHENLLSDVPIFMKEQSHPSVTKTIGSFTGERKARVAMQSSTLARTRTTKRSPVQGSTAVWSATSSRASTSAA